MVWQSQVFYQPTEVTTMTTGGCKAWPASWEKSSKIMTGWCFLDIFVQPLLKKRFPIWRAYLSDGLVQPPTRWESYGFPPQMPGKKAWIYWIFNHHCASSGRRNWAQKIGGSIYRDPSPQKIFSLRFRCYTHDGSMGLVYSPTFTIKINHSCREIYHTWILWDSNLPRCTYPYLPVPKFPIWDKKQP